MGKIGSVKHQYDECATSEELVLCFKLNFLLLYQNIKQVPNHPAISRQPKISVHSLHLHEYLMTNCVAFLTYLD